MPARGAARAREKRGGRGNLMKVLVITVYAREATTLPLAYGRFVQGALYACWQDRLPGVHDEGFSAGGDRHLRLFTFGPIERAHRVDPKRKELELLGPASLEVRSPVDELVEAVADHLSATGTLTLGRSTLPVTNLEYRERFLFPARSVIDMRSPVTVHTTTPDGHTIYHAPTDPEFLPLVRTNLASKARALGMEDPGDLQLIPLEDTLRKRVTTFKGIYVTGWTGSLVMAAEPQAMRLLYYAGLGSANSQGFGMFDLDERPL